MSTSYTTSYRMTTLVQSFAIRRSIGEVSLPSPLFHKTRLSSLHRLWRHLPLYLLNLCRLNPFLSQNSNPLVLPPAFSLHTTQAIPSHSLITPFHSCITPSSMYLADPLNAYANLGMPKPYVHLLGPPLDVALDARIVGNHGRFTRWGCKPNAVLRPILCERGSKDADDESTLGFGVSATKDMKENEDIVLGWEGTMEMRFTFYLPCLRLRMLSRKCYLLVFQSLSVYQPRRLAISPSTNRPYKIKNQMSNILHTLSSTFTTCACGALSKDCALTQMAAFVDGHDLGSLLRRKDQPNEVDSEDDTAKIGIGPLVGRKRRFRTKERVPFSGGLGGMQMAADEDVLEWSRFCLGWETTLQGRYFTTILRDLAFFPQSDEEGQRAGVGHRRGHRDEGHSTRT